MWSCTQNMRCTIWTQPKAHFKWLYEIFTRLNTFGDTCFILEYINLRIFWSYACIVYMCTSQYMRNTLLNKWVCFSSDGVEYRSWSFSLYISYSLDPKQGPAPVLKIWVNRGSMVRPRIGDRSMLHLYVSDRTKLKKRLVLLITFIIEIKISFGSICTFTN